MHRATAKRLLPALAALLVSALLLPGCGPRAKEGDARPGGDRAYAVAETRDIDTRIEVTGDVTPDNQLEVRPEVGGKVKKLSVKAGDTVEAGQVLVEIDDEQIQNEKTSAQTEIDGAQLQVEKVRRNFERAKELFESELISREVFDNLSSEYELSKNALLRARTRLELVEERLGRTVIKAPMAGTALEVRIIEGQVVVAAASVNSGTLLLTLADLSKLSVTTHVNQIDVTHLRPGQRVDIFSESLGPSPMEAEIRFIAPVATVKNGIKGFRVDAAIKAADERLRPGMSVRLEVPVAQSPNAVAVPVAAVFRGEDDSRVVYVSDGEKTEKRKVEIGLTNYRYAEIKSGLREGEKILLSEPGPTKKQKRGES